jgi:hypothetical protein
MAHIALGHLNSPWSSDQSRAEEIEADLIASRSLKGNLIPDAGRPFGTKPSEQELELDRSALAAGIGLVWVGVYEDNGSPASELYPPVAHRLHRNLAEFDLAEDSGGLEILSDLIKVFVDPQGKWPVRAVSEATAQAAFDEACSRLDAYLALKRNQSGS